MTGAVLWRRLAQAGLTVFAVVVIDFLLFRILPGDPARLLLGDRADQVRPELLAALRQRMGIDRPILDQFLAYLGNLLTGDLGYSFRFPGRLVAEVIGERIGPTILLVGLGLALGTLLGIALGAVAGWRQGRAIDHAGINLSLVLASVPGFWLGTLFVVVFAAGLHLLPSGGMLTPGAPDTGPVDRAIDLGRHLVLPVVVLALAGIGSTALVVRSSLVQVSGEDYITTARAIGMSSGRILRAHALPNALLPVVTITALSLGFLVAGAVTIETVFSWPGLGLLTSEALGARDYPVLQGIFLLLSISVIGANLLADLLYAVLDPRVRAA